MLIVGGYGILAVAINNKSTNRYNYLQWLRQELKVSGA